MSWESFISILFNINNLALLGFVRGCPNPEKEDYLLL